MMMMIRDVIITLSITVLVLNLYVVQVQEVDLGRRAQSLFSGVSARCVVGGAVCLFVLCLFICLCLGFFCLLLF